MALVWHEKVSRTALQTSSLLHTHTLLVIFFACKFDYIYIKYILTLFLSKQLTINKCTLLDCTNTEILMYCINLQYKPLVRYYLHTLFWYRHTYLMFPPLGLDVSLIQTNRQPKDRQAHNLLYI